MKKSGIAMLIVFFILIPLTLYAGTLIPGSLLSGRSYYITGTMIILEVMIPFFMAFEGRKPQARELVVIAVLCALAVVGRVAIPIPHFKAAYAIIMLSGVAFGAQTGFVVGAVTAFASNFFYGQGPYLPWQMMAYGAGGMLMGFLFGKHRFPRKSWVMAVVGFLTVVFWIGPLLDSAVVFLVLPEITFENVMPFFVSGFPVNIIQGVSTAVVIMLIGKKLLEKLERIRIKYGIMEE